MSKLMSYSKYVLIILLSITVYQCKSPSIVQENRSKVGIRPYPRDHAHELTGGDAVANWKPGIGNYDEMLKADDYTALQDRKSVV